MTPRTCMILVQTMLFALVALAGTPSVAAQESGPVDMRVELRSGPAFATPGGTLRLQATFLRSSRFPMTEPRLSVELPPGVGFLSVVPTSTTPTCTTPATGSAGLILCHLAPSDFVVDAWFEVSLSASLLPDTFVYPVARVSSDDPDPDPSNNESIAAIYLQAADASADLGVVVTALPDPVAPGGLVTHRIVVSNSGPNTVVNPRIQTAQPSVVNPQPGIVPRLPGTSTFFAETLPDGWSCSVMVPPPIFPIPPFGYHCRAATLPVGSVTLTLTSTVRSDVTGPLGLSATVSSDTPDPLPGNNASGLVEIAIGFAPAQTIPANGMLALALLLGLAAFNGMLTLRARR